MMVSTSSSFMKRNVTCLSNLELSARTTTCWAWVAALRFTGISSNVLWESPSLRSMALVPRKARLNRNWEMASSARGPRTECVAPWTVPPRRRHWTLVWFSSARATTREWVTTVILLVSVIA